MSINMWKAMGLSINHCVQCYYNIRDGDVEVCNNENSTCYKKSTYGILVAPCFRGKNIKKNKKE